jgi:hypothetical protein
LVVAAATNRVCEIRLGEITGAQAMPPPGFTGVADRRNGGVALAGRRDRAAFGAKTARFPVDLPRIPLFLSEKSPPGLILS